MGIPSPQRLGSGAHGLRYFQRRPWHPSARLRTLAGAADLAGRAAARGGSADLLDRLPAAAERPGPACRLTSSGPGRAGRGRQPTGPGTQPVRGRGGAGSMSTMTSTDSASYVQQRGRVLRCVISTAEHGSALSGEAVRQATGALTQPGPEIGAVLLTGEGP